MAALGRNIKDNNFDKMYMISIIILYKKCMISKLIYGLSGFNLTKAENEQIALANRRIIRGMANLPTSTPKAALYNEFGTTPIWYELAKRKMMMWWRINRKESNDIIKQCRNEQVNELLPWMKDVINIGIYLGIEIESVNEMSKGVWKRTIRESAKKKIKEEIERQIGETKRYKSNVTDEIKPGKPKKYMMLHKNRAVAFFRARADILDPTPRNPYNPENIWKCRFCNEKDQSTKHYVVDCMKMNNILQYDRERTWEVIRSLDADEEEIRRTGNLLLKMYGKIND